MLLFFCSFLQLNERPCRGIAIPRSNEYAWAPIRQRPLGVSARRHPGTGHNPLRRLALSVLFTIATTSYQTTCTVSERTFNKRQHANATHGVEFLTLYALRHGGSSDTALKEESRVDVSQCQLLGEQGRWGQSSWGSKTSLRTTSSTRTRKGPRTRPERGSAWLMRTNCAHHQRGRRPGQLHPRDRHSEYSRAKWH